MIGIFTLYGEQIELYGEPLALYLTPPVSASGAGVLLRRRRR